MGTFEQTVPQFQEFFVVQRLGDPGATSLIIRQGQGVDATVECVHYSLTTISCYDAGQSSKRRDGSYVIRVGNTDEVSYLTRSEDLGGSGHRSGAGGDYVGGMRKWCT